MKDNEQNFTELKKLLKLKQHEIPPPGYFNHFSGDVISRIRSGEAGASTFAERLEKQAPWLMNFLHIYEAKPGIVGGLATSLCLLLLLGVVFTENTDPSSKNIIVGAEVASQSSAATVAVTAPNFVANSGGIQATTNPAVSLQPVATLFGQANPLLQSAGFSPR